MKEKIIGFDYASLYPSSYSVRYLFSKRTKRMNKINNIFNERLKQKN